MPKQRLEDLYLDELRDLYSAEQQILEALPKLSKAASHRELKDAFDEHTRETRDQVRRLEQIFDELNESPTGRKCHGIAGVVHEGELLLRKDMEPDVMDAGLIAAAQRVEHYEIAVYGTARTLAKQLGREDQAELLQTTLDEEGETDKELTRLAEGRVNPDAARQ